MTTHTDTAIEITKTLNSRLNQVDLDNPEFGRVFSDHMLEVEYRNDQWQTAHIKPYGTIEVTPALNVFHYAQTVFEGAKAYYVDEKAVNLFRIDKNYERFARSCERMCIPVIDKDIFIQGIIELIKLDHQWVPRKEGNTLYLRPFAFAFDPVIAARAAENYRFYVISSPVGSYYDKPVKLITSQKYVRSVKGGIGDTKAGANYGPSLYPARKAQKMGFDQILWLDAFEHKYVEEVGTMNMFFVIDDVLITPALEGTILPGVTRDSIIQLAKKWDIPVEERRISIKEVMKAGSEGTLQEAFGAGTAAIISYVEEINHDGQSIEVHSENRGPVAQKMYKTITNIQYGKIEDSFGWTKQIEVG